MWIGEILGRRKTILVGTTIMTIGAILQISAYSVAQMIVARIIAGIGNGINTATGSIGPNPECDIAMLTFAGSPCMANGDVTDQVER